jgi:hypothetical protein
MRTLPRTALMVLAAFALGLVLGGETPRNAAAADTLPPGISWKVDGNMLTLTNLTKNVTYLVQAWRWDGEDVILPARTDGQVDLDADEYQKILVYRIDRELICEDRGCRPCNEERIACPIPEPIFAQGDPESIVVDPFLPGSLPPGSKM